MWEIWECIQPVFFNKREGNRFDVISAPQKYIFVPLSTEKLNSVYSHCGFLWDLARSTIKLSNKKKSEKSLD